MLLDKMRLYSCDPPEICSEKEMLKDYSDALLHLIWHKKGASLSLIFAQFELWPRALDCDTQSHSGLVKEWPFNTAPGPDCFRISSDESIFYIRKISSAEKLVKTYRHLAETDQLELPFLNGKLESNDLKELQDWPILDLIPESDVSTNWPYVSQCWGSVRAHHLYAAGNVDWIGELLSFEKPSKWLEHRLQWDLGSYPSFWGSAHLTLPNPFFSRVHTKLAKPDKEADYWRVRFLFKKYEPESSIQLRIQIFEKQATGLSCIPPVQINIGGSSLNQEIQIGLVREPEQIAYAISSPNQGLLDYQPFTGFIKNISLQFGFAKREKIVFGSERSIERNSSEYSRMELGENSERTELGERILRERYESEKSALARKKGEVLISSRERAREIFGHLSRNRNEITIVDPFISREDIEELVLPTCADDAQIEVITAAGNTREDRERLKFLLELKNEMEKIKQWKLDIRIQDDRICGAYILVNKSNAWMTGCSLHKLGTIPTFCTSLYNSKPIIELIRRVDSVSAETWINEHK